jgi:hypothetical protein
MLYGTAVAPAVTALVVMAGVSSVSGAQIWAVGVLQDTSGKFSRCVAISEDARWVVGNSRKSGVSWPFYWSATTGIQDMGNPGGQDSTVTGCASLANGSLVACGNIGGLGRKWSGGNWTSLPANPSQSTGNIRSVYAMSRNNADGETWIVGSSYPAENEKAYRYRWSNDSFIDFWGYYQDCYGVARNGWAVGKNNFGNSYHVPRWRYDHPIFIFNWNENCSGGGLCGWDQLPPFEPYTIEDLRKGRATAINPGATWAVGYLTFSANLDLSHAFKWPVPANPQLSPAPEPTWPRPIDLGVLGSGDAQSFAYCVSDSSANPRIGGTSHGGFRYNGYKAVYWDNSGCHDLYVELQGLGADLAGWSSLSRVYGISANGQVLVGTGFFDDDGNPGTPNIEMGFVTDLVAPSPLPPAIQQHPAPQVACTEGSAEFTVAATGPGTLTYRWQKNNADLNNGGHYSGVTTPTLQVSAADSNDAASYRCVVSNLNGSTHSNSALLTVASVPPPTPGDGSPVSTAADRVTWMWTNVVNESGYRVKDAAGQLVSSDLASNTTQWSEAGLAANTTFTRLVAAFNPCGESAVSAGQTALTLAADPSYGTGSFAPTVTADRGPSAVFLPADSSVNFTATNGFGAGPARVGRFGWLWNQSAVAPTGWAGEQFWTAGVLSLPVGTAGEWYLHLRSYNSDTPPAVSPGLLTLGPYTTGGTVQSCLANAGFEAGFTAGVAANWTKYNYAGNVVCADETAQVHGGAHAQEIYSANSSNEGGVYQRFSTSPGLTYTVRAWFKCSNSQVSAYLGVDPHGATDPHSGNVWWGDATFTDWGQKSWTGVAQTTQITVYLDVAAFGSSPGYVWIDDVEPACGVAPPAPIDAAPVALGTGAIRWTWNDVTGETGYRVRTFAGADLSGPLPANAVQWDETAGLAANTQYTRRVYAFNGMGESSGSTGQSAWTLSMPPAAGSVIPFTPQVCSGETVQWIPVGGFGAGKVQYYRYAWDQNPTYTWTGSEPQWSTGLLSVVPAADGTWYLHVQGHNGSGVPNGTWDYAFTTGSGIGPDFDGDCDVDSTDLNRFLACADGFGAAYTPQAPPPGCDLVADGQGYIAADFDRDYDVDQSDFGVMQRCLSGQGISPWSGCAD